MRFCLGLLIVFHSFFGVSTMALAKVIPSYYQEGAAPKYFHDEDRIQGICVDYIEAINQVLGSENAEIQLAAGANFSRIKEDLKTGKIAVFFGITKN